VEEAEVLFILAPNLLVDLAVAEMEGHPLQQMETMQLSTQEVAAVDQVFLAMCQEAMAVRAL
jgi:hypothetical protein